MKKILLAMMLGGCTVPQAVGILTLRPGGIAAVTIGDRILVRDSAVWADTALIAHEKEHVAQWRRHGPLFALKYVGASIRCFCFQNKYETAADSAAGGGRGLR